MGDDAVRTLLFNKPFNVLSQFTDREGPSTQANNKNSKTTDRRTLSAYIDEPGVYPAGRLDLDSEGLLVLTSSGALQHKISHPQHKLSKCYWVQVEGQPNAAAIAELGAGVLLKDGPTARAKVQPMPQPNHLWPRQPPIRFRKTVADSWLQLTITEGRNRQVRRMTAAVGHPTLRLIRYRVGNWTLDGLASGKWRWV